MKNLKYIMSIKTGWLNHLWYTLIKDIILKNTFLQLTIIEVEPFLQYIT
jgi:hypothetical protein